MPILRAQIDEQLNRHDRAMVACTRSANQVATLIGHAAEDWEATDLNGRLHRLKDYRGKVVILDFWYRGCIWCMRAMPQVARLAEELRDQPVVFLGMSVDSDENDAKLVAETMGLDYPVLRASELRDKCHVPAFPTLMIMDQKGVFADVYVGYSPQSAR